MLTNLKVFTPSPPNREKLLVNAVCLPTCISECMCALMEPEWLDAFYSLSALICRKSLAGAQWM
jgi:hypothetical protein